MLLSNDLCTVKIYIDETYTINSADNKHYDIIYNHEQYRKTDYYKVLIIHIDLFSKELSIALIGDYYSYDEGCALLNDDILTVLQNDDITQINVKTGLIINRIHLIDNFGINYAIYKSKTGYIIYGEINITALNNDFQTEWTFSGRDIWASVTGKNPFELCDDRIKLYDFNDNYYEIDLNGKVIKDIPSHTV